MLSTRLFLGSHTIFDLTVLSLSFGKSVRSVLSFSLLSLGMWFTCALGFRLSCWWILGCFNPIKNLSLPCSARHVVYFMYTWRMLCLPSNLLAFPASGGKGTPSPLECPLSTHLCSYVCVELFWVLLGAQSRASPTPVLFQDTYTPWPHSSGPAHYITDWLKRGKWVGFGIEVEKVSQIQGSFSPQSLEFLYFFHSLSWHFIPLCLYHVFNGIAEEISIWKAYL